jgi:CDP-glycerol glycerophosphotransferase (TagB/SpsB family)
LELPDYVERLGFHGQDIRSYFARSAAFVTDFSSMAFNAAYIERPVVYFQFDQARYFGGAHFGKEGYFDYAEQGFGPVTLDLAAAEDAIVSTVESGPIPAPKYLDRIHKTFPYRDGRARERVTSEIEQLLGTGNGQPKPSYSTLPEPQCCEKP